MMTDFLNLLIDAAWLQQQFDAHPRDMWAFTAFVFTLGLLSGSGLTFVGKWAKARHDAKIRAIELEHERLMQRERAEAKEREKERKEREVERKERERLESIERENVARLQSLPPKLKSVLKETYDKGTMRYDYASSAINYAVTLVEMKVMYSVGSDANAVEYMVMPEAASLIRAHYGELFPDDSAREVAE